MGESKFIPLVFCALALLPLWPNAAVAITQECESDLSFYHTSVINHEYASGFLPLDPHNTDGYNLLQNAAQTIMVGPKVAEQIIAAMDTQRLMKWLHGVTYMQAFLTREALTSNEQETRQAMMVSASYAEGPIATAINLLLRKPSADLRPYFDEMKVISANLRASYLGRMPSYRLQTRLAIMTREVPELARYRPQILLGQAEHLASYLKPMSQVEFVQIKKLLDEFLSLEPRSADPAMRFMMVSHLLSEVVSNKLSEPKGRTTGAKNLTRFLVDLLPPSLGSTEASQVPVTPGLVSFRTVAPLLLERAREIPDLLSPRQIAVVEFLRDSLAESSPGHRK